MVPQADCSTEDITHKTAKRRVETILFTDHGNKALETGFYYIPNFTIIYIYSLLEAKRRVINPSPREPSR